MEKKKNALTDKKVKPINKSLLTQVADKFKNKELFPEKIERAKKFLGELKSFPS